jgi:hypothetical protein
MLLYALGIYFLYFLKKNKTPVKFLLIWQEFIFFAITNDTVLRIIGNGEIHLYFYAFNK